MVAKRISAEEKRWQAQNDLDTLRRAQEITSNRTRLSAAKGEANKQTNMLKKVKSITPKPAPSNKRRKR